MNAIRMTELNSRFNRVLAENALEVYATSFKYNYTCRQRSCFHKIASEVALSRDKQLCNSCSPD